MRNSNVDHSDLDRTADHLCPFRAPNRIVLLSRCLLVECAIFMDMTPGHK
jgi:hypothetical protein